MGDLVWALIPLTAIVCIIGIPVWTAHQRQMMQLRLKLGQNTDASVTVELQALRQELAELRDTSTRYDMSFDSALQRIESRVGHLEGRVATIEAGSTQHVSQESR